mmetsp:Transcript_2373/g.6344  ORF Transcript_2373/g.6344 Transcript_2373/m.6344 type:complete len:137 (-) Transcript_2373:470-880(-)
MYPCVQQHLELTNCFVINACGDCGSGRNKPIAIAECSAGRSAEHSVGRLIANLTRAGDEKMIMEKNGNMDLNFWFVHNESNQQVELTQSDVLASNKVPLTKIKIKISYVPTYLTRYNFRYCICKNCTYHSSQYWIQ